MNIKEAESRTGITRKTIRFYEEAGLIKIQRAPNTGYRILTEENLITLREIKLYRDLGLSVSTIRSIVNKEALLSESLLTRLHTINNQINGLQIKRDLVQSILNSSKENGHMIYDMEDIIYLDNTEVKEKLLSMDKKDMVLASMGASPAVNEYLQSLRQDIDFDKERHIMGRVPIADIETAQMRIVIRINS